MKNLQCYTLQDNFMFTEQTAILFHDNAVHIWAHSCSGCLVYVECLTVVLVWVIVAFTIWALRRLDSKIKEILIPLSHICKQFWHIFQHWEKKRKLVDIMEVQSQHRCWQRRIRVFTWRLSRSTIRRTWSWKKSAEVESEGWEIEYNFREWW